MTLLITGIALDRVQVYWHLVFLSYLYSIISSGWVASPTNALVFLEDLGLKLISGSEGIGFSLVFIGGLVAGLPIGILFIFFR